MSIQISRQTGGPLYKLHCMQETSIFYHISTSLYNELSGSKEIWVALVSNNQFLQKKVITDKHFTDNWLTFYGIK